MVMAVVKTKVIKPAKLKEKEMRLELLNGLRTVARAVERDYKETVKTWKTKPEFETIVTLRGGKAEFLVGTDNEIYRYVDEGTKPHPIFPKKAKFLRFQSGYSAKTTPGIIGSTSGGRSGSEVFSRGVQHPGTKPRKFSELINKKYKSRFKDEMHDSMKRAAKKSGHAVK